MTKILQRRFYDNPKGLNANNPFHLEIIEKNIRETVLFNLTQKDEHGFAYLTDIKRGADIPRDWAISVFGFKLPKFDLRLPIRERVVTESEYALLCNMEEEVWVREELK